MDNAVKGDAIPITDNLALHCQPTSIKVDATGAPSGVTADAFRVDADGISTNWIEFSGGFAQVCALFRTLRTVRKTHIVGVLAVNDVEHVGRQYKNDMKAIHDPIDDAPPNPGHALIVGAKPSDELLLRALALLVSVRNFV
ncbi:hypothetical protein [Bradyrhizobium sp. B120]|uniref:hypothetical protein n=1 Tax=Bradyrhizobium sp. B120 TaxID=3410088 RepID=UPI003B97F42A